MHLCELALQVPDHLLSVPELAPQSDDVIRVALGEALLSTQAILGDLQFLSQLSVFLLKSLDFDLALSE